MKAHTKHTRKITTTTTATGTAEASIGVVVLALQLLVIVVFLVEGAATELAMLKLFFQATASTIIERCLVRLPIVSHNLTTSNYLRDIEILFFQKVVVVVEVVTHTRILSLSEKALFFSTLFAL